MATGKHRSQVDRSHSLTSQAYLQIRDRILRGELALGEAVSRRSLAAKLGMSFIPVQSAMIQLEEDGLLESRPRVGTRVRIPTAQDIRDRYIIREALEVESARLYSEKASSAERVELAAMARRLDALTARKSRALGNQFEWQSLHVQLHMRIAECGRCRTLCDLIEKNQVLIFNWIFDAAANWKMLPRWHGRLVDVLTRNDPDAAAHAMHLHIQTGMSDIQAAVAARFGSDVSWMQERASSPEKSPEARNAASWRRPRSKLKHRHS